MENSRAVVFLVAGIFLSLIIFAGYVSWTQKNPTEPADSRNALPKVSLTIAPGFKDLNSSPGKLPSEIEREMWPLELEYHFSLNKWEFDPDKKNEIILYALDIRNESLIEEIQEKQIGNFTVHIVRDSEFEKTRSEVRSYLTELRKNPEYQIAHISMVTDRISDTPGNYAELLCNGNTPENRKLDGTLVKGWRIVVYPMSPMPARSSFDVTPTSF